MPQAKKQSITGLRKRTNTTEALCRAHGRAYISFRTARENILKVKKAPAPRIWLHVQLPVKRGPGVFPPLKKGEFRSRAAQVEAGSHEKIDEVCERYIRIARREGKW